MDSPESFWSQPDLVASYARGGDALAYEREAIGAAVQRAGRSGPVRTVHVLGVGAGRELPAVRELVGEAQIVAWDISRPMVEACRTAVARAGLRDVTVLEGDLASVRLIDQAQADVVIALGAVLGYLTSASERDGALATMRGLGRVGTGVAAVVQQRYGRPDWAAWFAASSIAQRLRPSGALGVGNRRSSHGTASTLFHHYTAAELRGLFARHGLEDLDVRSLRAWARTHDARPPWRSPNPLVVNATMA